MFSQHSGRTSDAIRRPYRITQHHDMFTHRMLTVTWRSTAGRGRVRSAQPRCNRAILASSLIDARADRPGVGVHAQRPFTATDALWPALARPPLPCWQRR